MTPLDPRALRNAFGTFLTGVTVVTALDKDGAPIGFTANSFSSVSIDPPLVLVCLANTSQNYDTLVNATGFAVNILSESQTDISNTFARPSTDRFSSVVWHSGPNGAPVLDGVSAWFDCAMHKTVEAGDHVILIGEVAAFDQTPSPGLGYARGAYVRPANTVETVAQSTNLVVSTLIERDGKVLMVDDGRGGLALPETLVDGEGAYAAVKKLIASTGLQGKPGFVYSVFEDVRHKRQHISFLSQAAEGEPTRGVFVPLDPAALDDVSNPATLIMLERFAEETVLGNYGIYCGDQSSGEVRPISQGS